jgi:hypothetical protein
MNAPLVVDRSGSVSKNRGSVADTKAQSARFVRSAFATQSRHMGYAHFRCRGDLWHSSPGRWTLA